MMEVLDRVHELAAQVAELSQQVATLTGQVAANCEIASDVRDLMKVLQEQKPQPAPVVNVAPSVPRVEVGGTTVNLPPLADCEVVHEWGMEMGHFVPLRSVVTRKGVK